MAGLSDDTEMEQGRPPLGPAPDSLDRPQPDDAPGAGGAGGWPKLSAPSSGGWNRIDDVGDDGTPVWRQT
jgi:hypothetical protein